MLTATALLELLAIIEFDELEERLLTFDELLLETGVLDEILETATIDELLETAVLLTDEAVLVGGVSGDFEPAKLLPRLKALLAKLPRGKAPGRAVAFTAPGEVGDFVEKQPREQAVVFQAFPGPGLLEADYYVGEVADELFSGMSSRLFERVREEKGLAYFVRSSRLTGLQAGMFSFYAGTSPKTADAVLEEIDAEIARVQAGKIGADELVRCKTRLKAARRMGLQTNSSRAMNAGLNVLYGLPVEDTAAYDAHIDAAGIADLKEFARRRFQRKLRTQLVVTP